MHVLCAETEVFGWLVFPAFRRGVEKKYFSLSNVFVPVLPSASFPRSASMALALVDFAFYFPAVWVPLPLPTPATFKSVETKRVHRFSFLNRCSWKSMHVHGCWD